MSSCNRYSRRLRMYKEGYLSVCVYLNVTDNNERYYDIVVYRRIRTGSKSEYHRGANLKPTDLPILQRLLLEAEQFLVAELGDELAIAG